MNFSKTTMIIYVTLLFVLSCSGAVKSADALAGNWVGESICTIKNSPCHDEHVIYRLEEPDPAGKMKIQMDKVVNGKPEIMGTVNCSFDTATSTITCLVNENTWKFKVAGKTMDGTLTLADGRLYRRISVRKEK